jgi:hypothetical protein
MNAELPAVAGNQPRKAMANGSLSANRRPIIEFGWIVVGDIDGAQLQAVRDARKSLTEMLSRKFPEFEWKMPLVTRTTGQYAQRAEPIDLLDIGVTERNLRNWDFTLIVTAADLIAHYQDQASAILSRSMQCGVVSLFRFDHRNHGADQEESNTDDHLPERVEAIALRVLLGLAGIDGDKQADPTETTAEQILAPDTPDKICEPFRQQLRAVADSRLEERTDLQRASAIRFYTQAIWINRGTILKAVLQAKPWQFPIRLSRLTTTAASGMLIFMLTAETWELGSRLAAGNHALLATLAIVATTMYVVFKHHLLARGRKIQLSEVVVVTRVSTILIVIFGMIATFLALAALAIAIGYWFFPRAVLANWTGLPLTEGLPQFYLSLSVYMSALGIFIGALGASFEENRYFRHVTHVDEEI